MSFQAAGLTTIVTFYAIFFAVGAFAGRRREKLATSEQLLLANRELPLVIGVLTMTATWVGGGYINGTAEAVFNPDGGLVWAQAPWGYALSLILGGLIFAAPMRRLQFTTLMDLFERRYDKRIAAVLFLPALMGEIFWSAAILAALGTTLATVLDLSEYLRSLILISAAIAVTYTVMGGLRSVCYTDTLQLVCIFAGLCLAIPFALEYTGGLESVLADYRAKFGERAQLVPPAVAWTDRSSAWGYSGWSWSDTALLLIFGGIPWQVYFQRVLACRDDKAASRFSVMAGIGCLVIAVPAVLIGMIGTSADWSATQATSPPENAALILPYVLRYLTPPLMAALGLGAVAAAVMSSVDSSILSASSMLVCNVYRPLLRETAGDREIKIALRCGIVLIGLAAALLALSVGSVYTLWFLCGDLVYVILFPQLVAGLFFRGANKIGAVAGILVGFVLRAGGGEPALGIPMLFPYPLVDASGASQFPFRTAAMVASLMTIVGMSWATRRWSAPLPLESAES